MRFLPLIVFILELLFIALSHAKEKEKGALEQHSQSDTDNVIEELIYGPASGEPFMEEGGDFSKFNVSHLLEVQFINQSLMHYQGKAEQVQSSLQSRVQRLLNLHQQANSLAHFSPLNNSVELQQKLNDTIANLLRTLDLSPVCWASLNMIRSDLSNRKLWPLKCKTLFKIKLLQIQLNYNL